MSATNVLNIPLFDNDAEYFLESSFYHNNDTGLVVITGGCNKNGNGITLYVKNRILVNAEIKRRVGKYSVTFVAMGRKQEARAIDQLKELNVID